MNKNSLIGVSIANRLLEGHDTSMQGGPHYDRTGPHQVIYVDPTHDMRFIGRWCTVAGERSGGYVLKAALNERYGHESGFIKWHVTRLKPGWTPKHLQRACHRAFFALSEQRTLKRNREQVYILAESRQFDLDRVDAIAKGEGRSDSYESMTIADCEFWKVELAKFPAKAET